MRRGSSVVVVVVVAVTLVLLVARDARAQPGNTPVTAPAYGPYAPAPPAPTGPLPGEKSPGIAMTLSLGGTIASYVLIVAADEGQNDGLATLGALGVFLMPTSGHWYAGKVWTDGLTLRAAGIGAVFVGAMIALGDCGFESECDDEGPAIAMLILGTGAYVGGTVLDIATAPGQARRYNARLRERATAGSWAIAPTISRDGGGLVLGGRF
ncbi:MAG TPA: hypothetical protein VM261_05340 [Kofleriaceae bacterium]|nr:hypothetical protein [Kofleriaceae bacterium]